MPYRDLAYYLDSVGWTAVTAWSTGATIAAGVLRRQLATPAVNSERVFISIVAGTTHATTEPTWVTTRGGKTTDNTVTWQECTGLTAVNGDIATTVTWAELKAFTSTCLIGQLVLNNTETHIFIMSTAGTIGASQPSFNTTTGVTTADNTATWTCIGAVGAFSGGQAPYARAQSISGDVGTTLYIKSSHAETSSGNVSLVSTGTYAQPQRWICHNGGAYPPAAANVTTGATITTSGSALTINSVNAYIEGLTLVETGAGASINVASVNCYTKFKNCMFVFTGSSAGFGWGNSGSGSMGWMTLDNCGFSFSTTSQTVNLGNGTVVWKNSTFYSGSAVPTLAINVLATFAHVALDFIGVDFSGAGSGKTIFNLTTGVGLVRMVNCKLGASVTVCTTPTGPFLRAEVINCDSGTTVYRNEIYDYMGTLTSEATIVLTGGSPVSWKIVTTANVRFEQPFVSFPLTVWNDDTGVSKTLTVQGIWGGGAVPNNDDIWVEVEYLGSSATPIVSFVNDTKATVLTTGAAQDAGAGTWGGSTTKFALAVTFTPQMKGVITARVKCAKVSSTFYIDPKITLT